MPLLSIVTRTCDRAQFLTDNIRSVKAQTMKSIEQIFIVDYQRKGVFEANKSLAKNVRRVDSLYTFLLDDDCWLINDNFVYELYDFIKQEKYPQIIMVKSKRPAGPPSNSTIFPTKKVWASRQPKHGTTNCLCYVVKTPLWKNNIVYFGKPAGGDWGFLDALIQTGRKLTWLDTFSGESRQLGRGKLFEKTTKGWFERVAKAEGLTNRGGDDWRLELWKG